MSSTLLWPVPGSNRITSYFGKRESPTAGASTNHKGIDIGGDGLDIVAAKSGTVSQHNPNSETAGNMLVISHNDGTMTRYLHMVSGSNTVSVGAKVSAGDIIGKVGNTGVSTGPHLHFEYLVNGVAVDPLPYFSDTPTTSNPVGSTDVASTYMNHIPYSPDYLLPVRSSAFLGSRPMHAYFKIYIGDKELMYTNQKPHIYQSFEMNRLEDAGCTAQFTIFDDNWDEIESYLAANWRDIHMKYGYSDGSSSPMYKMLLQDYTVDFNDTGVVMSIRAISEGIYTNLELVDMLDTGTKNPGEAIRFICNHFGWKIDESDFATTDTVEDREENYILRADHPITYIQQVIIPEARTNQEICSFYIDADDDNTAHLKVSKYGASTDDVRTYIYMKGYDSVVQSISFNIKGVFAGTSNLHIATGLTSSVFSTDDKEEYTTQEDQNSVLTAATGIYSHTVAKQSIPRFTSTGESPTQLSNKLYYYIKNSTDEQYEATMVIIGDPEIELFEDIRIINMTDFGFLHHTSGIYQVYGISDSINNGIFLTTLKLIRNGDINEGVELRNPRYTID